MRISTSIFSGYLEKGITGISDFLVMQEDGTLTSMEYVSDEVFTERFGVTKDQFYDLIAEKVLGEEIYGV